MSNFGKYSAFPQRAVYDPHQDAIIPTWHYNAGEGLNIQQHVWLTLAAGALSGVGVDIEAATKTADAMLPAALKRLEELS